MTMDPADVTTTPATLTREQAEAFAAEANAWMAHLQHLGPVPIAFNVTNTTVAWPERGTRVGPAVRLTAIERTGPHVMFLNPELAEEVAGLLTRYAQLARTGLILGGS